MVSRSVSFGPSAGAADTESLIGSAYSFPGTGTIKKIRITGYQGVTDKADNGILFLYFKKIAGSFEWSCYGAGGEITVGGRRPTEEIETDIK